MKRLQQSILLTFIMFSIIFIFCVSHSYAFKIEIDVAPNILSMGNKSVVVTVHTDILFDHVDKDEPITLNKVPISFYKSDDRGYFVAKFVSDEIKNLYLSGLDDFDDSDGQNQGGHSIGALELTLKGFTTSDGQVDGDEQFEGTDQIMIIENLGSQKKN